LGTSLVATEVQLAEARAAIAAETGAKPEAVDLRPADVTPRGAMLMLTLEGQPAVELARANPSALAPYSAAFSAMLRGDQAKQANAALKAGTGRLDVAYDLDLPMTRAVTAHVEGNPGEARDVEAALAAGDLELSYEVDEGASAALKAEARGLVLDEVERMLRQFNAHGSGPKPAVDTTEDDEFDDYKAGTEPEAITETAIDAHVTRTEPAPRTLHLVANVADWL
jgi:hypothetical protein